MESARVRPRHATYRHPPRVMTRTRRYRPDGRGGHVAGALAHTTLALRPYGYTRSLSRQRTRHVV
jgi:hypothetical protein